MNTLEKFCAENHIGPARAMNYLQTLGFVSDNAVGLSDVAESDCLTARLALAHKLKLPLRHELFGRDDGRESEDK